jgi:hypothetical protein
MVEHFNKSTIKSFPDQKIRHGQSFHMTRAHRMNLKFNQKEVTSPERCELMVDGGLDEIVDEFSDGRVSYGCIAILEESTDNSCSS